MFTTPFAFMAAPAGGGNLLLDLYPGAKRAYSVRKLSSSYSGPALRVRRSSDNTEQDIGFVGEDLDTAAITSFVGANDGFVTTWYDQSGNGANATQSTATAQSTIVSAGTIYTAGTKPAIYASSGRSYMTFTTFTTNQVAQLLVGKKATATSNRLTGFSGDGDSTLLAHWNDNNIYFQWEDYYAFPNSGIANINYEVIFASTTSVSTSLIQRNGSSLALSNTFYGAIAGNYNCIFMYAGTTPASGNFSTAYEQELVIWDSNQSANAAGIDSNVNAYYSIY